MSKYTIYLSGTVSAAVEVEADDLEEATRLAIENAPQTSFADADFDGVDEWEVDDDYEVDGEYRF